MLDQAAVELLALLQLCLHQPACAPRLRFLDGPLHGGRQAFEAVFEEIVGCAEVQTPHRLLVADGAGNHDDGHIRSCLLRVRQGGDPVVAGQVVVAEDEIEGFPGQRRFKAVFVVDPKDVAGHALFLQPVTNHFGVPRAILQMEHSQWIGHF